MGVSTVISYCTNDYRFIGKCIEEAEKFSSQVIVVVCDHFFDGTPENRALLDFTYQKHPHVQFVEFPYLFDRTYCPHLQCSPRDRNWPLYWHTTTRAIGYQYVRSEIESIFFLDSDEIAEGSRVAAWLKSKAFVECDGGRFLSYYYALNPYLRATMLQELPLLMRKRDFIPKIHAKDRCGIFQGIKGPKKKDFRGLDGLPLFHHYSWVRPQGECLRKAESWGHRSDANWPSIIARAFKEKRGISPVGMELEFETVEEPFFDPLLVSIPKVEETRKREWPHVSRIGEKELSKMEFFYE